MRLPRTTKIAPALVIIASLLLAACGGGGTSGGTARAGPVVPAPSPPAVAQPIRAR